MDVIKLPEPIKKGKYTLEEIIRKRRSIREFDKNKKISLQDISTLLYSAYGITDKFEGFRTAPSAGALYPLEIFLAIEEGVFLYNSLEHSLVLSKKEDIRKEIARASLFQHFIASAPVVFIFVAVFERTTIKYGKRGIGYVFLDAGHSAQNLILQATALEMGGCPVGAFDNKEIKKVVGIKEGEPVYIIPIGKP